MSSNTTKGKWRTYLVAFLLLLVVSLGTAGYLLYRRIFLPNVTLVAAPEEFIYIRTGSGFREVMDQMLEKHLLKNPASFEWLAGRMKYTLHVKPGRYRISQNMNNRDLVSMLRSGNQVPTRVVFQNIRTRSQFASVVSSQIEADSISVMGLFADTVFLARFGVTPETCLSLFIPNTYEFYWNTSARKFIERMANEYNLFWTRSRREQAAAIGLTRAQVSILASIVEQETQRNDEKPIIAGVYMNRYRKGWKLEADPTLVYAAGDFTIRRVLNAHKEIDSPYNTYLYAGLPPGPICIPSATSLDAVLNYSSHEYMFFCARDDFSGYHSFAKTYSDHLLNARRFQNELNRRKIKS